MSDTNVTGGTTPVEVDALPVRQVAPAYGLTGVPLEQLSMMLTEYDQSRTLSRQWLLAHLVEGVHYGFPPGCRPATTDRKQWQAKPSLYKAGALLLTDLLHYRMQFEADTAAWEQMGKPEGTFVMRCQLVRGHTGEVVGEGRGVFATGEKNMNANSALKMAEKRAHVDAVINTVAVCADLFTQDLEDTTPTTQPTATETQTPTPPPTRSADTRVISEPQQKRLFAIARQHNVSHERVASIVKTIGGVEHSKDIRRCDYEAIVRAVETGAPPPGPPKVATCKVCGHDLDAEMECPRCKELDATIPFGEPEEKK